MSGSRTPAPNRSLFARLVSVPGLVTALAGAAVLVAPSAAGEAAGFLENRGQLDPPALFYAQGERTSFFLTDEGVVVQLHETLCPTGGERSTPDALPRRARERRSRISGRSYALRLGFAETKGRGTVEGRGLLGSRHHFLLGDERGRWRSGVPAYQSVVYRDLWPGIEIVFRLEGARLLYEIDVLPGAVLPPELFRLEGAGAVEMLGGQSLSTPPRSVGPPERRTRRESRSDRVERARFVRRDSHR